MSKKKIVLRAAGASLAAIALLTAEPLRAESSSDSARLEKLERAVELLAKQNAELQAEIKSLKKETTSVPDGKFKKENYLRRKNVHRESRRRRKAAGLRAAAWTRIETGAGRIHPDEFRRR